MVKDAWVLKANEKLKQEESLEGDFYYSDDEYTEFLTGNLNEAAIFYDKDAAIVEMKQHEKDIIGIFGKDAIINAGYTNIMSNFDWFEVEVTVVG